MEWERKEKNLINESCLNSRRASPSNTDKLQLTGET